MRKRILLLAPTPFDLEELNQEKYLEHYEFISFPLRFYDTPVLLLGLRFDVLKSIEEAIDFGRKSQVDGVIATLDYPASLVAAAVAKGLGLPGPPVDKSILCHHKFLCRQAQQRAMPEAVPPFALISPLDYPPKELPLPFPFFVKPVKGSLSVRAGEVRNRGDLDALMKLSFIEKTVAKMFMKPLNQLIEAYTPFDISANYFIAEGLIPGESQVTVEGFVHRGQVEILGVTDSTMYPGTISFSRFEYPSRLPREIRMRMEDLARRSVEATGFDQGIFNVEMKYDSTSGRIMIVEMNPRICTQFSDFYEKVDGVSSYEVLLSLATGERPPSPKGQGRHGCAASFVLRIFEDRKVLRLPSSSAMKALRDRFPDAVVQIMGKEGEWLSQTPQDRGSFRYATINLGAKDHDALLADFQEAKDLLPFVFDDRKSWKDWFFSFRRG